VLFTKVRNWRVAALQLRNFREDNTTEEHCSTAKPVQQWHRAVIVVKVLQQIDKFGYSSRELLLYA
jgi:hypothetical protein